MNAVHTLIPSPGFQNGETRGLAVNVGMKTGYPKRIYMNRKRNTRYQKTERLNPKQMTVKMTMKIMTPGVDHSPSKTVLKMMRI